MNEDFVMRPGDRFMARECGCAMNVIMGPADIMMATMAPRCCCGHEMEKAEQLVAGTDIVDIPEAESYKPILAGMIE